MIQSVYIETVMRDSQPPLKPSIPEGPTSGVVDTEYTFTASTTDPDGDDLSYLFEWGDDEYSGWIGPVKSGQSVEASHKWNEEGEYKIRVIAKDWHGVQGEWSDPLPISMPKKKSTIPIIIFIEEIIKRIPIINELFEYFITI